MTYPRRLSPKVQTKQKLPPQVPAVIRTAIVGRVGGCK